LSLRGVRPLVVVLALVVTLGLLFGARWLYHRRTVSEPLAQAVGAVEGVQEVKVVQENDRLIVRARVGPTPRLEELVASIGRSLEQARVPEQVELVLSDTRTPELEAAFYDLHFFLQEAVTTGRYSELPARVNGLAEEGRVDRGRVFVSTDCVYVQLELGGSCLYEVIPRPAPSGELSLSNSSSFFRRVSVSPWGS